MPSTGGTAGGGLVATVEDYNTFIRAFANNEIFADPATRETMFDWVDWPETNGLGQYGLGVMRINYEGIEVWGHAGVGQSFMFYWPDGDVTICGTLNQQEAPTAFTVAVNVIATLLQS